MYKIPTLPYKYIKDIFYKTLFTKHCVQSILHDHIHLQVMKQRLYYLVHCTDKLL